MPHILLLGSEGLLGSSISYEFAKSNDLHLTTSARTGTPDYKLNYTPRELSNLLRRVKPDLVINCIACTSPNTSFRTSFLVNSVLPIQLAIFSKKFGYQTIHFSTNAVFSGNNRNNTERAVPIPRTKYGLTKLLGDLSGFRNLIIRTSFVGLPRIATSSSGLVLRCKSAKPNEVINIDDNYLWNGLTIEALIQLLLVIIYETKNKAGIFHIGSSGLISREELIKLILVKLGRGDVFTNVEDVEKTRNMALETIKVATVASWWAKTKYKTAPNLIRLLNEAKFD